MTYTPNRSWRTVGRGLAAVARLLVSAADALITAAVGVPPIGWCVRQLVAAIRETYRLGRFGEPSTCTDVAVVVVDAEIIDKGDDK
jgi:hypothetical protein